ncbi:putative membrane protein [Thiocapsa sp. KS1]|nr:anti-phage ZorAB system protein ZorA [Thiocapsa sp. KS1]CRI66748.1 putative membrane protein [Thiocapsa sp. KS1]
MTVDLDLLLEAPPALLGTGSVLVFLVVVFVLFFLLPGLGLRFRLSSVLGRLRRKKPTTLSDLQTVFSVNKKLTHLWNEFRDTLHAQHEEQDGQLVTVALRATAPAESFFNGQYIVDSRLRTEFFKHLPGILTGIGIIGTFLGLITGLQAFKVSEDAGQVRESLEFLLGGVFEAFLVSASAITLAMVVTLLEKLLLASLYRCTEEIAQYLDSVFVAGAGEEYLARLVAASEDTASQSKILKDALVGDLKVILQEMTERQIAAATANSESMGRQIAGSIENSLQGPLQQIGGVVAKASGDQSAVAADLLKDIMASFSQRLNDLFGGQISGIQELNQKSAESMQEAVASINQLVAKLADNSQRSGDAMAERMAAAVEDMERRQADINQQTQSFVEAIREMVASSQTETNAQLNASVSELSRQVTDMVGALQAQAVKSHEEQQRREQSLSERTSGMVTALGDSIGEVVKQMATSTSQMQQSVASLERTTATSIDKLNAGARTLEQGAIAFATAGDKVTGALDQASTVANKMTEVSGALTSSALALQSILADYGANRDATNTMLVELRAVVDAARREASMTQRVLDDIQTAATKLAGAQKDTELYLEGVSNILAQAQSTFNDGLTRTLDRANSDFHNKLSSAVGLLSSSIEELEASLAGATGSRR